MKRLILNSLAALAVVCASSDVMAITHTWTGAVSNVMSSSGNWSGGVPVDGSSNLTLIFPNTAPNVSPAQTIAGTGLDLQSMQVTGNYTMATGGSLGYLFQNLGAAPTMTINGGAQFLADIAVVDPMTVTLNGGISFDGLLTGSGDMTVSTGGFSNVTIAGTGNNTYTGTLTINNGIGLGLNRSGGFALQGDLVVDGNQANVTANVANQFGPNADLTVTNQAYFQMFNSTPQTIRNVTANNTGQVVTNNGTLTVTGSLNTTSGFGLITTNSFDVINFAGGLRTVDVQAGATMSIQGMLTNGRIDKTGAGTVQMYNAGNTFTGQNIVSGGTLSGTASSIGNDVLNNATVEISGGTFNAPVISGTGNVLIQSFVTYNAAQTYTGGTDIAGGFSNLTGTTSTLLGNFSSSGFGTLNINQAFNGTFSGSLSGNLQVVKQGAGVVALGGVNTHTGQTTLGGGGLQLTTDTALGSAPLVFNTGANPNTLEAIGSRTFANQLVIQSADLSFVGSGNFNFTDSTAKTVFTNLFHNSTGNTTIAGKFTLGPSATVTVNSGTLELGNPSLVGGFTAQGALVVNGGTLKVNSLNFTTLPDVTLAGGTLDAPNGYAIPLGAALQGTGNVLGRVATANGSTIIATGAMGLGDLSHPAGVNLDGELYTNQFIVGLSDSNQAVLGSLTDIGTTTQNGMLSAGNGFVLNFGRNIVGRGQLQSNNLLNAAAIINGSVQGDSFVNYLEFTGYVKGVGTFNNVAFSGTFSPGLSPTLMTTGSIIYTPTNVLDMELGGLNRGSQYDAFDISGPTSVMLMDGTLQLSLINAFTPSLGNQFLLFQGVAGGSFTGTFDTYNFPSLNPGLAWDISLLYSNGIVQVVAAVPEPASLATLLMLSGLFVRRRPVGV
jgi:fibronectin-binding autotransporter adhesin